MFTRATGGLITCQAIKAKWYTMGKPKLLPTITWQISNTEEHEHDGLARAYRP
jgi:hypothetical protein